MYENTAKSSPKPVETAVTKLATTNETRPRPAGPVQCVPWCAVGDGHPNEAFQADQWCASVDRRVDLSRDQVIDGVDPGTTPWLSTYAMSVPGRPAFVALSYAENAEIRMTAREARYVALALLGAAEDLDSTSAEATA